MSDDPRELARRLAEEAKNKLKSQDEDPRELARRLAEEAKQRAAAAAPAEPAAPSTSLPDGPPPERLTAQQALEREREARRQRKAQAAPTPAPSPTAPTPLPPPPTRTDLPPVDPTATNETTSPGGAVVAVRVITAALPGSTVVSQAPVQQLEVARALWQSHLARAQREADPQLVTTAHVLLHAFETLPPGRLVAARATVRSQDWAFWVDVATERLVATAHPAEVYLAGS